MKTTKIALLAMASCAAAQGVNSPIAPPAAPPAGCTTTFSSNFEITILKVTGSQKRDVGLEKRSSCATDGILVAALSDGVLKDAKNRTGYIASNRQFQFDEPAQAGAIYTAGFSVCQNSLLALGGSTVWWQCQSGDFYNLYDSNELNAAQCSSVEIAVIPCDSAATPNPAGQIPDGQIIGSQVIQTTVVVPLSDGQPQVVATSVTIPICQITDGQLQVHTVPCTPGPQPAPVPTSEGVPAPVPVSQYSDGQIQVTPPAQPGTAVVTPPAIEPSPAAPAPAVPTAPETPVVPPPAPAVPTPPTPGEHSSHSVPVPKPPVETGLIGIPESSTTPLATPPSLPSAPASGAPGLSISSLSALVVGLFAAVLF